MHKEKKISVLVTRPAGQNEKLRQLLENIDAEVVLLPTIEIKAISSKAAVETLKETMQQLNIFDFVIFTSSNAVLHSQDIIHYYWPILPKDCQLAAIGANTKAVLEKQGWSKILCPKDNFSSETLLALPEFQSIPNLSVLIISGKHSRQYLFDTLKQRGAEVKLVICYERSVPVYQSSIIMSINQKMFDFIVCSSNESLSNLSALFQKKGLLNLQHSQIIGFSDRLTLLAENLGFSRKPIIAANASDEAVVDAIVKNIHLRE